MSEQERNKETADAPQAVKSYDRRTFIKSLGIGGAAIAAGGLIGNSVFPNNPAASAFPGTGTCVYTVINMADLKALDPLDLSAYDVCFIAGYYAAGDGGGGEFYWDAASTETNNGGTIINPTGYAGIGRWKRA